MRRLVSLPNHEKHNVGIKLHAIKQLSKGSSSRYLVDFYGTSFKQICNWADRFDKEGVAGLRLKPGRGRRCRLSEEQQYQIQGVLLKSPEEFGYNTANWTGALLGEHIFKTYRVEYKLAATYNLMKKLGFSYQRAKAFYPERDEVKRAQVKAEIKKT